MKKVYWYKEVRIPDSIMDQVESGKDYNIWSYYSLPESKKIAYSLLEKLSNHLAYNEQVKPKIKLLDLILLIRSNNLLLREIPNNPASQRFFRMLDKYVEKVSELEYNFNYKKGSEFIHR